MRFARSVVAVLLGYAVFGLSAAILFRAADRDPHAAQPLLFTILAILYGVAFAGLAGFVAARLAPAKPAVDAAVVAGLIAIGATASLVASPGDGATWSQWAALLLMAPSELLSGRLGIRSR